MDSKSLRFNRRELFIYILILLFVFQNPAGSLLSAFSYLDEVLSLCVLLFMSLRWGRFISLLKDRKSKCIAIFVCGYLLASLLGNILFQYQKFGSVVIDFVTNIKFYLSILFAGLAVNVEELRLKKTEKLTRFVSIFLFCIVVADYAFHIFPADYRYGFRGTQIFYGHPTYLAAANAFLVILLSYFGAKKNLLYILMNLLVMVLTLRSKAIASAAAFVFLYYVIVVRKKKFKVWQIVLIVLAAITIAWSQIYFYFIQLGGRSARSVMLMTSLRVMKEYFPIGTGFATFGSHEAAVNYSPVYVKYGFREIYELRGFAESRTYFDDQFWPIVFAQSGVLGTICYLSILVLLFSKIQSLRNIDKNLYLTGLFSFIYLLISSTSEPAFNNALAVPIGIVMGMVFRKAKGSPVLTQKQII